MLYVYKYRERWRDRWVGYVSVTGEYIWVMRQAEKLAWKECLDDFVNGTS